MELYNDDEYDYDTGKFKGMKKETQKLFNENLHNFYSVFVDNQGEPMPENIKKFSDIKLRDYSNKKICESGNAPSVKGTYKDELFLKYADNLKAMIQSVNVKQEELLSIINKIFVYVLDPVTEKEVIRINPDLTESGLQELIVETRKLVIELYLKCETDFVEGVKIYEAIVESQIFNTTQKHIEQLEKEREKLIAPYKQPSAGEMKRTTS
jgi:putative heme iron utilization protein